MKAGKGIAKVLLVGSLVLQVLSPVVARAEEEELHSSTREVMRLTLEECIRLSQRNRNPEWQYHHEILRGQMLQVMPNYFPRIQVQESLGPLPNEDYNDVGLLHRIELSVGVPIYDFGRSTSFYDAARLRLLAEQKGSEVKGGQDVLETVQLYYGILLARESLEILLDAQSKLEAYEEQLQARYQRRSVEVSRADILQMELETLRLEQRIADTQVQLENGFDALRTKIGFDRSESFDVEERSLRPIDFQLGKLEEYQDLALKRRPEVSMFEQGLEARRSVLTAEERSYLPALLAGGFLHQGIGTSREDDDDFNFAYGGVGVRLNWNFDWTQTQGRIKTARSEYLKLAQQRRLALPAIELDVRRAYRDALRSRDQVERGKKASKVGRALLFFAKSNWDLGIGDPVRLKDALIRANEARFHYLKSIFDFNVAVAKLSQSVGEDLQTGKNS